MALTLPRWEGTAQCDLSVSLSFSVSLSCFEIGFEMAACILIGNAA